MAIRKEEEETASIFCLSLVRRCGFAAPTYRRSRSCGQDARAPLCSIGAARPQRPTIQSLEHDVPRTGTASPRHNKKATTDWSGRLENYFAAKAANYQKDINFDYYLFSYSLSLEINNDTFDILNHLYLKL